MYNLLQLPKLQEACNLHYNIFRDYIFYRIKNIEKKDSLFQDMLSYRKIQQNTDEYEINQKIRNFILGDSNHFRRERLEVILGGKPDELFIINEEFENYLLSDQTPFGELDGLDSDYIRDNFSKNTDPVLSGLYKELCQIFNYTQFKNWEPNRTYSSYKLAEKLGMRACTYCNRDYILVQKGEKNSKLLCPQYDHWFPKSKFPLLQVSFYNLIPSCGSCNSSVKGDDVLKVNDYCHPYMPWDVESFYFTYYYDHKLGNYKIVTKSTIEESKLLSTIQKLKIDQMYNGHLPELKDIIDLKRAYGERYLSNLKSNFPKLNSFKPSDVYRIHFGTEMKEIDFHKKPMSKFKKDILLKLNLIDKDFS